jgi:hypothetical protein
VYCRAGYYAQCDNANPNGKDAGTAFYGGPSRTGPFDGLQAEYARVPFATPTWWLFPLASPTSRPSWSATSSPTAWFGARGKYLGIPVSSAQQASVMAAIRTGIVASFAETIRRVIEILSA